MENIHEHSQLQNLQFLADHSGRILITNPRSNAFFPKEMMRLALHYGHAADRYSCILLECDIARGTVTVHGNMCRVEVGLTRPSVSRDPYDIHDACFELSMYSSSCIDEDGDHTWLGVGQFKDETEALAHACRAVAYFDTALEVMHNAPTIGEKELPQ